MTPQGAVILAICFLFAASYSARGELNRGLYPEFHEQRQPSRSIVLILETFGLANRLRALADWYVVARASNRELILSWRANAACNAPFEELFQTWPGGLQVLSSPLPPEAAAFTFLERAASARNMSFLTSNFWMKEKSLLVDAGLFLLRRDLLMSNNIDAIFTNYNGNFMLEGMPCQVYKHQRALFYNGLVAASSINSVFKSILQQHFSRHIMVGVHVRAHDPLFDWAVVPPNLNGTEAVNLGTGITPEHFSHVMRRISLHFRSRYHNTASLSLQPNRTSWVRFFAASNSEEQKQQLLEQFGDELVTLSGEVSRSTPDGMKFALLEFLLLSHAQLVVHTFGSSFAVEAAAVHQMPTISVTPQYLVYSDSRTGPFCSDTLVAAATAKVRRASVFYEGTFDRREISSHFLELNMCEALKGWGLTNRPSTDEFQWGDYLPVYCMTNENSTATAT